MPRSIHVEVPGQPRPKSRPRVRRDGRVYPVRAQYIQEQAIKWGLRAELGSRPFLGSVRVEVWFYREGRGVVDVDNLLKLVLDAGNEIAWVDDRQVKDVTGHVEIDASNPRTVIEIVEK